MISLSRSWVCWNSTPNSNSSVSSHGAFGAAFQPPRSARWRGCIAGNDLVEPELGVAAQLQPFVSGAPFVVLKGHMGLVVADCSTGRPGGAGSRAVSGAPCAVAEDAAGAAAANGAGAAATGAVAGMAD